MFEVEFILGMIIYSIAFEFANCSVIQNFCTGFGVEHVVIEC